MNSSYQFLFLLGNLAVFFLLLSKNKSAWLLMIGLGIGSFLLAGGDILRINWQMILYLLGGGYGYLAWSRILPTNWSGVMGNPAHNIDDTLLDTSFSIAPPEQMPTRTFGRAFVYPDLYPFFALAGLGVVLHTLDFLKVFPTGLSIYSVLTLVEMLTLTLWAQMLREGFIVKFISSFSYLLLFGFKLSGFDTLFLFLLAYNVAVGAICFYGYKRWSE
jgi:hypothetical protein